MSNVVIVADGAALIRHGLAQVLGSLLPSHILVQTSDAAELLQLSAQAQPVLIIVAFNLTGPVVEPVALLNDLRRTNPAPAVVAITDPLTTPEPVCLHLLRHGINALLPRTAALAEVCETVETVLRRGRYYSDEVITLMQSQLGYRPRTQAQALFTERQVQVLQLIAEDQSSEEIAGRLCTSVRTVEYHRSQMLQKAGVRTTLGLVLFALREGLLQAPAPDARRRCVY
jgi:DNA-binding NarL/FixJ family response regulator